MIPFNLFQSNWSDNCKEIIVLKSVNKLYLVKITKKSGQIKKKYFKYFICLLFKSGKIRPNFNREL